MHSDNVRTCIYKNKGNFFSFVWPGVFFKSLFLIVRCNNNKKKWVFKKWVFKKCTCTLSGCFSKLDLRAQTRLDLSWRSLGLYKTMISIFELITTVREFDEKTHQDKQNKTYFETMERFLGLWKYLYFFCKSIVSNMKRPLLYYYNHLTYSSYTVTNYHATVRQLK